MRYLSLSWKVLLLMQVLLFLVLICFTSLSFLHINEQFSRQQEQKRIQGQQYFQQYNYAVEQQLLTWFQTFTDLQNKNKNNNFNDFAQEIASQSESLQVNFGLKQLSLFDQNQQLLYQFNPKGLAASQHLSAQVLQLQQPKSSIFCLEQCYKQLGIPLLNRQGEVAVLIMTTDLTDVLLNLHQTLNIEVAIISIQPSLPWQQQFKIVQASDHALVQRLYNETDKDIKLSTIQQHGLIREVDDKVYYLQLIDLDDDADSIHLLLMLEDISTVMQDNRRYQQQILLLALASLILLLLLIWVTTRRMSQRILQLAQALPLLAKRQYSQFRQQSQIKTGLFPDELTTFQQSVTSLANELEQLDEKLVKNTAELHKMAMFDSLTGLGNRNSLQHDLSQALLELVNKIDYVGLVFLDLDNFKNVNNSRSHTVGDQLLVAVAKRLQQLSSLATIYRVGGDEFALLLTALSGPASAEQVAQQLQTLFIEPFSTPSSQLTLSASIGISLTKDANSSAAELTRQADLAMYQSKQQGRNCYYLFTEQMSTDLAERLQLEAELKQAIKEQQFSLSLQPKVCLTKHRLHSFEALIRWQHPTRGAVPPDVFIEALEQAQLMVAVGYWVFERCCQLSVQMMQQGLTGVTIAVNLSATQFLQADLAEQFSQLLDKYQLSGERFELELTESTLVNNISQTLDMMYQLKDLGFTFAIDDFGTGYSSLNYLKRMPVDTIKIDKSFVQGMQENEADLQIVISTIAMVHKLGLKVVAEGVETAENVAQLQGFQCDILQGYYFSRPIPETQINDFIKQVLIEQWPQALLK
ncbi:bifunctional diguanylate cyclase/phosphodiesterase [Rheinheimera sp. MMS21-TC3]|uniref:putative bifunctional diguanylate cyclase/phosphodiesterase n=1 Tax=Rheinheimera sp. MMS21-TC3 TaxID=3072790 RepID=UPI0028C510B1|nr:bifunctional diguanylate cyclase/phosphodiesterase [Rheinheimera sp. MMS21-TC3]WNO59489.1 bifunctional diguanylate cyclase/phosphodiesterase [Rheinheimera sp. MMS21-TC3]